MRRRGAEPGARSVVKITATTAGGHSFVGTAGVQVVAAAPLVPVLNVSQLPGQSSLTVSANGAATTDAWNLVGGTIDFGEGAGPVSANPWDATTHTFARPGPHTVTLTVTDAGGNTAQTTQTINVGSALVPFGPVRFLDTRYGTGAPKAAVGPRGVIRLKVAGANGIPATGVTAVTLNLTGLDATSGTWIAAYPDGTPLPTASNLNLLPGQVTPNPTRPPAERAEQHRAPCAATARGPPRLGNLGSKKRHTCGSLLTALDIHPRVAMKILRHSQLSITMEIYTHVTDGQAREALRKLGDALG